MMIGTALGGVMSAVLMKTLPADVTYPLIFFVAGVTQLLTIGLLWSVLTRLQAFEPYAEGLQHA